MLFSALKLSVPGAMGQKVKDIHFIKHKKELTGVITILDCIWNENLKRKRTLHNVKRNQPSGIFVKKKIDRGYYFLIHPKRQKITFTLESVS